MEDILFDSYRKFQKDYSDPIKNFKALPIAAIILLIIPLLLVIVSVVLICISSVKNYAVYAIILEAIFSVILYFYTENFQIKTSISRLSRFEKYCTDVFEWLQKCGVITTKENILDLYNRLHYQIDKKEKKKAEIENRIEKWLQIFMVPVIIVAFTALINKQNNWSEILLSTMLFLTVVIGIGVTIAVVYNILNFFNKRKLEQMKSFAEDLQGVLDTQFENKLILSNPSL